MRFLAAVAGGVGRCGGTRCRPGRTAGAARFFFVGWVVLVLWGFVSSAVAAVAAGDSGGTTARLGTNVLLVGRWLPFKAPLNAAARAQLGRVGTNVAWFPSGLMLPEGWDEGARVPLLVVCTPSGSASIPAVRAYTNAAARERWAVLAVDGPRLAPKRETAPWDWAVVASALDYLHGAMPRTRAWPLALVGFSGGAKKAACLVSAAVAERREVWGVFLGGCNEDYASLGMNVFRPGAAVFDVPVYLSNGRSDPIAGPDHGAAVRQALETAGFRRTKASVYAGDHRLDDDQLVDALQWFREISTSSTARRSSTLR